MTTRAVVLGGGGVAGIAWEAGLLVGLAEAGIDVRNADLFLGTSAGSAVAAQLTSSLTMDEIFQRQVDPTLQAKELPTSPNFPQMIADFSRIHKEESGSRDILRRIGALALATPTASQAERRAVIQSRLEGVSWPQVRLEVVTIDIESGERVVFHREAGIELVDAVTASCALPCVWPPATIAGHRYIDGGCYSMANVDLASSFEKVLVLLPDTPPFPLIESLDKQIERLRSRGVLVEVIVPDEALKTVLAKAGGNALDPTLRGTSANAGREQARREAPRVAAWWE